MRLLSRARCVKSARFSTDPLEYRFLFTPAFAQTAGAFSNSSDIIQFMVPMVAILGIMIILLAVLALVVVKALAESPWGVFTVAATIPIAMFMGGYLRFIRVGKVLEISVIGCVLLLFAVKGGQYVYTHESLAKTLTLATMRPAGFNNTANKMLPHSRLPNRISPKKQPGNVSLYIPITENQSEVLMPLWQASGYPDINTKRSVLIP